MRVDPKHLEKCTLWKGSILEIANRYGGISSELLLRKKCQYEVLSQNDVLTAAEKEFLEAMQRTEKEHG